MNQCSPGMTRSMMPLDMLAPDGESYSPRQPKNPVLLSLHEDGDAGAPIGRGSAWGSQEQRRNYPAWPGF